MSGPLALQYKKHMTLEGNSSILSLPLCHFSNTSPFSFLVNMSTIYFLGNLHAKHFGCAHFVTVMGISMLTATALGLYHIRHNNEPTIAGGMAITSGLITYNVFKNPNWFSFMRLHPYLWMTALVLYGSFENDKAV